MKLVDILARELKVWPEGCSHIVQDHDGECWPSTGEIESSKIFYDKEWSTDTDGEVEFYLEIASDFGSAKVTRAEWQAAVDALNADKCEHSYANNIGCPECGELNAPKVVEWDGVGRPPIGMASCEYLGAHKYDEWTVVNIFAHYGHTVFVDFGDGWRAEKDSSRFRPIRTAEQAAAEEIRSIIESGLNGNKTMTMVVKEIIEAGYRKQVAK